MPPTIDLPETTHRRVAPRKPKRIMLDPVLVAIIDDDLATPGAGEGPSRSEAINRLLAHALRDLYGSEWDDRLDRAADELLEEMNPDDLIAEARDEVTA